MSSFQEEFTEVKNKKVEKKELDEDADSVEKQILIENKLGYLYEDIKEYVDYHVLDIFETLNMESLIKFLHSDMKRFY